MTRVHRITRRQALKVTAGAVGALVLAGGGSAILLGWAPVHLWSIPFGVIVAMLALVVWVGLGAASGTAQPPGMGLRNA